MKADRAIFVFTKLLFQVLIFSLFYTIFIAKHYNTFFEKIPFVFFWLIMGDILAFLIALIVKILFNYGMGYLPNERKKRRNFNRKGIEYFFYTSFRCLSYIIGFTALLSSLFYPIMPILGGFFAYLLAWTLIFITSKILAKVLSIWITKTI